MRSPSALPHVLAAVALAAALPLLAASPAGAAPAAPCASWDLARDFQASPDQQNPNPDACGTSGVWAFGSQPDTGGPYSLLPDFDRRLEPATGPDGFEAWRDRDANEWGVPIVGKNVTGSHIAWRGFTFPAKTMSVHPAPDRRVVVTWRSPVTAVLSLVVSFQDLDPNCGNGVAVAVRHGNTTLAEARVGNGGRDHVERTVAAVPGDQLTVAVEAADRDVYCDSTSLAVRIDVDRTAATTLTGYRVVAGGRTSAGDRDATGAAHVAVDGDSLCYRVVVHDLDGPATDARLHRVSVGREPDAGGVALWPPGTDGRSEGCLTAPADLAADLLARPDRYAVTVATAGFPAGAVRGNLATALEGSLLTGGLSGEAEVDGTGVLGAGQPGAVGAATVTVGRGLLCWTVAATGIAGATAAHLHHGGSGTNGPVVVSLWAPTEAGSTAGCRSGVAAALLDEIATYPERFYVNVHTAAFPAGALRGNLGAAFA